MNEKTKIPLIWAAALIVQTAGGIAWITSLSADVAQAKANIAEQKSDVKDVANSLNRLEKAMIRVQTTLGVKIPENERGEN